jgi:two-component system sensor histidine kinase/response regulator
MEIINKLELSERLAGDMVLLRDLGDLFLEDYPNLIKRIENALQSQDSVALKKAAHTLKGSVANFSAQQAYEAAYNLEIIGKDSQLDKAAQAFDLLQIEVETFVTSLKELMQQDSIIE